MNSNWVGGIGRTIARLAATLCAVLAIGTGALAAPGDPMVFHAASAGNQTLDQGEGGGNPFASALIEILARPQATLSELPEAVRLLTQQKSRGFQAADVPTIDATNRWPLKPTSTSERRIALVLIVSDYSRSGGAPSLPGALLDGQRIAAALSNAGFETKLETDLDATAIKHALERFAADTQTADAAIIYTTGHGVEVDGTIFLIPGDYPITKKNAALTTRALPLAAFRQSMRARHVNLLFYGGCRDNPLGD